MGKTQSVRFLDEMPDRKRAGAKGKARAEKVGHEEIPATEVSERGPTPAASAASETEEDDDKPALPRTKSQLSMLIDKERKQTGNTNIGPEPTKQENGGGKEVSKNDDGDDEEENELLIMARRDKKGKLKDPDQPFKAAAKKGLWQGGGGDDDDLGGSRSPPPVF